MWVANVIALKLQSLTPRRVVPSERRTVNWGKFDAILIGGGDDVDVELYDGVPTPNVRMDPARDRLELDAIEVFLGNRRPILGVCRGSQILNVALGGTLHEDIHEIYTTAPRTRTVLARKEVHLIDGTILRAIAGQARTRVNSLHRQSIDKLGEGLIVSARDEHEIVQAVESETLRSQFVIGVQWHPEFLFYRATHRRLLRAFACAARGEAFDDCVDEMDTLPVRGR